MRELIEGGEKSFSFEFFPPKDADGEEQLWRAITELEPYRPTFVSVTYGAGGSSRDSTVRITGRIARETSLLPVAHLTCVGHTRGELEAILDAYAEAGVRHVLALRGDPEVLLEKQRAGAEFAITDMVFRADDYVALVERCRAIGVEIPIMPGIMPILNLRQVARMAELSGHPVPDSVVARLAPFESDPAALRAEGIAMAAELCHELLSRGAPGLHFYTLNRSKATREIFAALSIHA